MSEEGSRDPLRVFVCDDSLGFPSLIRGWCEIVEGIESAGVAASASEMLRQLPAVKPDVLLLDFMLPEGPTSAVLVDRVRELAPGLRVILISALSEDELAVEADRIGADAFCSKLISVEDLFSLVTGGGEETPAHPRVPG